MRFPWAAFLLTGLTVLLALTGCTLIPKNVEYFQDRVKDVPAHSAREDESLRQAADLAKQKARQTVDAAQAAQVPLEVLDPAQDTRTLTESVSERIGPPLRPWGGDVDRLAALMRQQDARLNAQLDAYRAEISDLVGKKIEGTGAIQMGYFTHLLLIGALVVVAWTVLKAVAMANPPLQVGMRTVQMAGKTAQRGLVEVIEGGQRFKDRMRKEFSEDWQTQDRILSLFTDCQLQAQSRDTQEAIKILK